MKWHLKITTRHKHYMIMVLRFVLAWTFIRYGWAKLTEDQFGLTEQELNYSVNEIDLFRLSWYVFDHEPFKSSIGIIQIICAILLLYRRTVLFGCILFLPVIFNILIIDLTIMNEMMARAFAERLITYILMDIIIIYYYRHEFIEGIKKLLINKNSNRRFPIWAYLLLPLFAITLEVILVLPKLLLNLF